MKPISFSLEFTETRYCENTDTEKEIPILVYFCYDDVGIGSYEFWGASGTDVNWQVEILDYEAPEGFEATDEEEEKWIKAGWDYINSVVEDDYYPEPDFDWE